MAARVRRRFNCSGLTPEQLHTQVLTLPRAELRYVRTVASLKAARVPYTLFNGTDGAQRMAPELLNAFFGDERRREAKRMVDPSTDTVLRASVDAFKRGDVTQAERASLKVRFEMGTSLSHLRLLMRMLVEDWEMMLVMEDDALVAPSFYRDLSLRMCRLPDNWDALQLFDCSNPRREAVGYTVANGLRLYKGGVCLAGKLYRRQYVLQLLQSKLLWRSNQPIDIVTRALEQSGAVRVFITEPMLVALNREVTSTINLDQHLHSASKRAPHEEMGQRNQGGKGEPGRRSGGLVVMNVYHKSGMWLAPRLRNVLYTAGLAKAERHVTSGFGNYHKCQRGPSNFCYGWRQEEGKPKMQCPTYLDCVRNGLHTVSQDSTAFLVHMPNGAFVCEDMAAKFDGPLPRMALMLRDPFSLVISSYIYHAQKPTPENWVINEFTAPCVPNAEQTATGMAYMAELLHIPHDRLLAVAALHKRLFDEGGQPYYNALLKLSRADGARLEASRYLMFMPAMKKNGVITKKCGDGLLVMAASAMAVNSRRLDGEVFMMGDWIGNSTTQHATMSRLLNLVCGDGDCSDPNVVKRVADDFVSQQQRDLGRTKGGEAKTLSHVTHLSHGTGERAELEQALTEDEVLGPLLEHLRCIITDGGFPGVECCYGQPNARCS